MTILIEGYNLGNKIVSLALDDFTAERLKKDNLDFVLLKDHSLFFWPDNYEIAIDYKTKEKFNECTNYDVFIISSNGSAYLYFDDSSGDNTLIITNKCNSNCIMCPVSEAQRTKPNCYSVQDLIDIVKHIPNDTKHLTITGGEPFLIRDDIFDILKILKSRLNSTQYLLLTNGRAFSYWPYVEKFLDNSPSDMLLGIPIHGYNEETHDSITRAKGSFNQTTTGLYYLLNNNVDIELRIVVSKLNYKYITDIAKLVIERFPNVYRVVIIGLEMLGNAAINANDIWIPYKDAFLASRVGIDLLVENGINVKLYNFPWCSISEGYHLISAKSITNYKIKYADKCSLCLRKNVCGGLFQGSLRFVESDVEPVTEDA